MTREEILKKANSFQGANREFSQELPTVIEGVLDEIDEAVSDTATDEDIDSITNGKRQYFTIETIEDGLTLSWLQPLPEQESHACTIEYSTDDGQTWHSAISSYDNSGNIGSSIPAGTKFIFRGNGPTGFYDSGADDIMGSFFNAGDHCYVYGNVMSLLYGDNFYDKTDIKDDYAFAYLFSDYAAEWRSDWVLSKEGCPLILPATTLTDGCYYSMFADCTSIITTPVLPATTLATSCYAFMFAGCTSLTTVPELNATTMANNCYSSMFMGSGITKAPKMFVSAIGLSSCASMFEGCNNLVDASEVEIADASKHGCCYAMFKNCTELRILPILSSPTVAAYCYKSMFQGCSLLTTTPELSATIMAQNCYQSMFLGCAALTMAPELPAATLADYCYEQMFQDCTSLNSIVCLATDISATTATDGWLAMVSPTGTFIKAAGVNWPTGASGIPNGWTVIEE